MSDLSARVPCTARTRTNGYEQFEQSALTVRPWMPGTSHELGVLVRRGSREYLLTVTQAHELANEIVDAAEAAQQLIQQPRETPHPRFS